MGTWAIEDGDGTESAVGFQSEGEAVRAAARQARRAGASRWVWAPDGVESAGAIEVTPEGLAIYPDHATPVPVQERGR